MSTLLRRTLMASGLGVGVATVTQAQTPSPTPTPTQAPVPATKPAPATANLRKFPSADAAAEALVDAIRKDDDKAVEAILGTDWQDFVPDQTQDEDELRAKFLKAWDEQHKIVPENEDRVLVSVGTTGWTMPIPIIKKDGSWIYDVEAGLKEVTARRIGHNELSVIQTLLAIIDAQREYAARDPMKTGMSVYARRLLSSPGKMDGLYWETKPGEPPSPIGPRLALAQLGHVEENGYFGYRFRLLYSQGPDAPGGAYNYLVNGRMLGGFAVLAWPVEYDETGVMTFMASQSGDVYERDLGWDTAQDAAKIQVFNPDKDWAKADTTP